MKLTRHLLINNEPYEVIEERVILNLSTPGRAQFLVNINKKPLTKRAIVSFDIGYNRQATAQRIFFGYIEKIEPVDNNRQRIFCREFSAVLNQLLPLNLRHVTLKEVLAEITRLTAVKFVVPDVAYANFKTANYYNLGNGYQAMDALSRVFQIPQFFWQQQGHGQVFVGSLVDSRWADKKMAVPQNWFNQQTSNKTAVIAAVPALRPGVTLNDQLITQLEFKGNQMTLSWGDL
jgi:hypothetical protein